MLSLEMVYEVNSLQCANLLLMEVYSIPRIDPHKLVLEEQNINHH